MKSTLFLIITILLLLGECFATRKPPRRPLFVAQLIHHSSVHSPFRQNTTIFDPMDVSSPVTSVKVGFQARLEIGSQRLIQFLFMDTGSSLLTVNGPWTGAPKPVYHPEHSSTYLSVHCLSQNCQNLGVYVSCSRNDLCKFDQSFPGVSMRGRMGLEDFRFGTGDYILPRILFGSGNGIKNANGVLGLGPGRASLPSQLEGSRFGYCIGNISDIYNINSKLSIGDDVGLSKLQTPLLVDVKYYITLKSIIYGGIPLDIDPRIFVKSGIEGGMVVDSGSTYTYIPDAAFSKLVQNIKDELQDTFTPVNNIYSGRYRHVCYTGNLFRDLAGISEVQFVFEGNVTLDLSPEQIFRQYDPQTFCLAIVPSESQGFAFSILGNMMLQYNNLVFDIGHKVLSIEKKTSCNP